LLDYQENKKTDEIEVSSTGRLSHFREATPDIKINGINDWPEPEMEDQGEATAHFKESKQFGNQLGIV